MLPKSDNPTSGSPAALDPVESAACETLAAGPMSSPTQSPSVTQSPSLSPTSPAGAAVQQADIPEESPTESAPPDSDVADGSDGNSAEDCVGFAG